MRAENISKILGKLEGMQYLCIREKAMGTSPVHVCKQDTQMMMIEREGNEHKSSANNGRTLFQRLKYMHYTPKSKLSVRNHLF